MQLTLHATRRKPHGASRLVQAMSAWSVETRRAPSRRCGDARVDGHTTTAVRDIEFTPLPLDGSDRFQVKDPRSGDEDDDSDGLDGFIVSSEDDDDERSKGKTGKGKKGKKKEDGKKGKKGEEGTKGRQGAVSYTHLTLPTIYSV